jgi:tRNA(fMet)-specific endonuclease VapC
MKILIDSSVIIDFLRRKDKENTLFAKLVEKYDLVVSLISVTELYSGKSIQEQETAKKILDDIISGMEIYIPNIEIALFAGSLRAKYQLSLADSYIASTAIVNDFSLTTLDTKDFSKIKDLKMIKN